MVWGNFYDSTRININIGDYLQAYGNLRERHYLH